MQMAKFLTDNVRLVTNIVKVRSTLKLVREWKSGGQNNDSIEWSSGEKFQLLWSCMNCFELCY